MKGFLNSISLIGSSPYALIGYVAVVIAWTVRAWFLYRPQRDAARIIATIQNDKDRLRALRSLVGSDIPEGLDQTGMLDVVRIRATERSRSLLLVAYVATLVTAILIVSLATVRAVRGDRSEVSKHPVLVESTAHRPGQ